MKRNYLTLIVVSGFLLLLQVGCGEQAAPAPEAAVAGPPEKADAVLQPGRPAPEITFENVVHDFGQIGMGAKKRVGQFKFTNTGDSLLKIAKVEPCCGVNAKLDKTEYAPGESGVLKAEFQSTNRRPGLMRLTLYVNSNDKTKPRVALTLKARIMPKVACAPKRLRLFFEEENAGCPKIVLSSLDNQPFAITQFKSTADCITADVDGSVEATKFVLDPRVDMEKLNDNLKGRIKISLTHPEENVAEVLFDVLPKFIIKPPLFFAINAEPQKPIVRQVSVLNNYGGDFEIESATSENNTIKVLSREKIRNGYQLDVEITPPPPEGKTRFADVFSVKIKGGDELRVICNGIYSKK